MPEWLNTKYGASSEEYAAFADDQERIMTSEKMEPELKKLGATEDFIADAFDMKDGEQLPIGNSGYALKREGTGYRIARPEDMQKKLKKEKKK